MQTCEGEISLRSRDPFGGVRLLAGDLADEILHALAEVEERAREEGADTLTDKQA